MIMNIMYDIQQFLVLIINFNIFNNYRERQINDPLVHSFIEAKNQIQITLKKIFKFFMVAQSIKIHCFVLGFMISNNPSPCN